MGLGITSGFSRVNDYWQSNKTKAYTLESNNAMYSPIAANNGERIIGLAMLPYGNTNISYGIKAQYAPESTQDDPVVLVTTNYGGESKSYNIQINEINPSHATQLEMFALLSYTDDQNISDRGTFGSYQRMKNYADNAKMNGYWMGNDTFEDFKNKAHNWQKLMGNMADDYAKAGIYSQMVSCKNLQDAMEKCSQQFLDFDNLTLTERSVQTSLHYMGPNVSKELAQAVEAAKETGANGMGMQEEDYLQQLRNHMEKLFVKIQNGETEPKFQIGSQSFTIKEWEKFLEKFDEVEEAIRELQEKEIEKRKEEAKEGAKLHMLTSETLQARFPLSEKKEDGSQKEVLYQTFYPNYQGEAIFCEYPGGPLYTAKEVERRMYEMFNR